MKSQFLFLVTIFFLFLVSVACRNDATAQNVPSNLSQQAIAPTIMPPFQNPKLPMQSQEIKNPRINVSRSVMLTQTDPVAALFKTHEEVFMAACAGKKTDLYKGLIPEEDVVKDLQNFLKEQGKQDSAFCKAPIKIELLSITQRGDPTKTIESRFRLTIGDTVFWTEVEPRRNPTWFIGRMTFFEEPPFWITYSN